MLGSYRAARNLANMGSEERLRRPHGDEAARICSTPAPARTPLSPGLVPPVQHEPGRARAGVDRSDPPTPGCEMRVQWLNGIGRSSMFTRPGRPTVFDVRSRLVSVGPTLLVGWTGRRMVQRPRDTGYGFQLVALDGSLHLAARCLTTTRPLIRRCEHSVCIAE